MTKKIKYDLSVESKIHCLATICINNIGGICNLKGVAINENGVCAGLVEIRTKEKDKD